MVVQFSPRCDGCHAVFKEGEGGDNRHEPVSVGCAHTLCRACAEGCKGAYGQLRHLSSAELSDRDDENKEVEGDEEEVDEKVKAAVRGRCGVCGGGKGGAIVVHEVALLALQKLKQNDDAQEADDKGKEEEEEAVREECDVCDEDQGGRRHLATHYCHECEQHMCDAVAKVHQRMKATFEHTLQPVEASSPSAHANANPDPAPLLCPTHQQPLLMHFCKTDRSLVCTECVVVDHHGHAFLRIGDELVGEMKQWLGKEVREAVACAEALEGAEAGLERDREAVIASGRKAIDDIDAVFAELEEKKKKLVAEVTTARKKVCQRLNDVRTTSRTLRQGIEALQEAIASVAESPTHRAIQCAEHMGQQLRHLVELSKGVRTERGDALVTFQHHPDSLETWRHALAVLVADVPVVADPAVPPAKWEARSGVPSQPLPSLGQARFYHGAAVCCRSKSNEVFVVGGAGGDEKLGSVERLGAGDEAWQGGLTVPTARAECGACAVGTVVVVVGGQAESGVLDIVEAVDTANGAHIALPSLPLQVSACGVASVDGKVVVTGGFNGSSSLKTVWALDIGSDAAALQDLPSEWAWLPDMAQVRSYHGAAGGDGRVFVCGGYYSRRRTDLCEVLEFKKEGACWRALPSMPTALSEVGCCFGGGNVFVAGGDPGDQRKVFALDVDEERWTQVGELATGREACAAVCVGKRLLVLGGSHGGKCLESCEAFDF